MTSEPKPEPSEMLEAEMLSALQGGRVAITHEELMSGKLVELLKSKLRRQP